MEDTRTPHFMVIDEYKRYINPQVEIFLSLAASYKVSNVLASQSLGQLEVEAGDISPRAMKQAIMTNCRNKLCFNGIGYQDAQEFADEFGKDKIMLRQSTYKHRIFMPNLFPDSYRDTESEEYRFDPTDIMDNLPKYSFIHKVMYEAAMQKPSLARGNLVPADWKEKKEWENEGLSVRLNKTMKKVGAETIRYMKRVPHYSRSLKGKHQETTKEVSTDHEQDLETAAATESMETKTVLKDSKNDVTENPKMSLQESKGITQETKHSIPNAGKEVESQPANQTDMITLNQSKMNVQPLQSESIGKKDVNEEVKQNNDAVKPKTKTSGDGFWD